MDAKDFFKLALKQYDRAHQFYNTHNRDLLKESEELEKRQLQEFMRVAIINEEIADYIRDECPLLLKHLHRHRAELLNQAQQKLL